MTSFFAALWLSIMTFLGFHPEVLTESVHTPSSLEQKVPTGVPSQSAPPAAIAACVNKTTEESCLFTLRTSEIQGVCKQSGTELACTPSFLE